MRRQAVAVLVGLLASVAGTVTGHREAAAGDAKIAAAASLRHALDAIAAEFERVEGGRVSITYGATGNLVRQLQAGAPFEAFFSADEEGPAHLVAANLTDGPATVLVRGSICFVTPPASTLGAGVDLAGVRTALESGSLRRLVIANPETTPYGRAAMQALQALDLAAVAGPRLIKAENVGQAAQYVASGAAEAGIVACALARSGPLATALRAIDLRSALHNPINQSFVVLRHAGATARAFAAFVRGPIAGSMLEKSGFTLP